MPKSIDFESGFVENGQENGQIQRLFAFSNTIAMMYVFEKNDYNELFLQWAIPYANFFVCSSKQQIDVHLASFGQQTTTVVSSEDPSTKCILLVIALFSVFIIVLIGATMAFILIRRMRKRKLVGGGKYKDKKKRKIVNLKETPTRKTSTSFRSSKSSRKSVNTSTKTLLKTTLKKTIPLQRCSYKQHNKIKF